MSIHWTPETDAIVAARIAAGASASVIAGELGTTRNAILGRVYRLRVNGLVFERPEWPRETKPRAAGQQKARPPREPKVRTAAGRAGPRRFTTADLDYIRKAYADFVSLHEMAEHLGRSWGVIRQTVLRMGLRRAAYLTSYLKRWPELRAGLAPIGAEETLKIARALAYKQPQAKRDANAKAREADAAWVSKTLRGIDAAPGTRNQRIVKAFDLGISLVSIGQHHGLTRERVRQITVSMGRQGCNRKRTPCA